MNLNYKLLMNSQAQKNLRLIPPSIMALAVSLPVALISLSKLLLLVSGIYLFFIEIKNKITNKTTIKNIINDIQPLYALIFLSFIYTLASITWTSAPESSFIKSLLQHGNLLIIPLLALHIKNDGEAISILKIFCSGQMFVVVSSWLMFADLKPAWAIATVQKYAVFSSELDQSIMNALFAAILWHLRQKLFPDFSKYVFIPILLSVICVFYVFEGRTGHIVTLAMISLAVWWGTPKKFKILGFAAPLIFILFLYSTSNILQQRFEKAAKELEGFSQNKDTTTSTGIRLDFWLNAIKISEKNSLYGSGAGSWSNEFYRMKNDVSITYNTGNPHQEYLLWLVELGIPGLVILLAIFYQIFKISLNMEYTERRATQSVLAGVMLACLFNCALHDAVIGDFLCFLIGIFCVIKTPNTTIKNKNTLTKA